MLCLIGKTASGKTTIKDYLIQNYGFHGITTYTTRPIRKGEVDGDTYYFVSEEEFNEKISNGFFAEWKKYHTDKGIWQYGTSKESIKNADERKIIILTPDGVRDILKQSDLPIQVIYVYSNQETIKKRLAKRKDDPEEIKRRLRCDNDDFQGATQLADKIVYNNLSDSLTDVAEKILSYYNDLNKK